MNKTVSFARHQAVGAYRRWEPPDFGVPAQAEVAEPVPESESELEPEPSVFSPPVTEALSETEPHEVEEEPEFPAISLPTAEEIEQIHEEARQSGFDEGLAEGRKQGHSEGREAGFREGREAGFSEGKAAAENEALQLHELVAQLEQALLSLDAEIAEELMSFAVEFARKIIQHTLAVEPEAVVSAIRAVLQTLPQSRAQIHLNPDDIALVRRHLDEVLDQAGHVLIEDETVSRGGCRVETPGAQIDATMETRWRRAIESLGREHSAWIPAGDRRTKSRRASDKPGAKARVKDAPAASDTP
ncbi:MAG: flagellar assembly protein FliH [Azoarcus sp.]|jgi:flagellar assembly protein FliH|nr:flagellar assembly protein FliH [Azoarcus sp.]